MAGQICCLFVFPTGAAIEPATSSTVGVINRDRPHLRARAVLVRRNGGLDGGLAVNDCRDVASLTIDLSMWVCVQGVPDLHGIAKTMD